VPLALISQASKAILTGTASNSITTLTEGVLHAMFVTKLKTTLAGILALAVIGSAGAFAYSLRDPPAAPPEVIEFPFPKKAIPDKPAPAKSAEELQKLLQQRRDMAEQEAKTRFQLNQAGSDRATLEQMIECSKRLLRSELELTKK
jgi:hypothetical protein